jgi:YggT family protein
VLDAAGAHALADVLKPTFALLTFMFIVRIPMTWYPTLDGKAFPWSLAVTPTEPLLAATRRVIPLVGGVDITPIVWVGLLSFFNEILLGPQGLLVLIERQGGI